MLKPAIRKLGIKFLPDLNYGSRVSGQLTLSEWQRSSLCCLAALVALPLVFPMTTTAIVSTWSGSVSYNHCVFIPLICAYLVWERRQDLFRLRPTPSLIGFGLLAASGTIWSLGELSGASVVAQFALAGMAQSIVVALLGTAVGGALLFPLLYLFFAIPVGDILIPHLQVIAAFLAVILLKLSGVPIRVDGLLIYTPAGDWIVAEACSGIRFLTASIAIGALLSSLFLRTWARRAMFMSLSVLVPIFANGIRVFAIILIGYLTGDQTAVDADHILYGWLLFALVTLLLLAIVVSMRETAINGVRQAAMAGRMVDSGRATSSFGVVVAALAVVLMIVGFARVTAYADRGTADLVVPNQLPMSVGAPWVEFHEAEDRFPSQFVATDHAWHEAYSNGNATVYLNLGYFISETHTAKVVNSLHRLADPSMSFSGYAQAPELAVDGQSFTANALRFADGSNRRLVWHWYRVAGRYTGNAYMAKLLQLKSKLLGGPREAIIISVAIDEADGAEETAVGALTSFVFHLHGIETHQGQSKATTPASRTERTVAIGALSP